MRTPRRDLKLSGIKLSPRVLPRPHEAVHRMNKENYFSGFPLGPRSLRISATPLLDLSEPSGNPMADNSILKDLPR